MNSVWHAAVVWGLLVSSVISIAAGQAPPDSVGEPLPVGWVTVTPVEYHNAINNPLKGFRKYKKSGYGLLERRYIKWCDIEFDNSDTVERIIAHTNKITTTRDGRFEDLNIKLVPRVFLDWNGAAGTAEKPGQHWPADLQTFDYDSTAFQDRLIRLVAKLGAAWDNDPRIFAVQMGIIGHFGEHHHPAPTATQRRLLTEAFQKAFKHKPVLVRHTDREFMEAGFGIHYDTFATLEREPPAGPESQFPWQATNVYPDIWRRAPIEGEVEYDWQQQERSRPKETFGGTPNETMTTPIYRRYMIDKIRCYHASYLGWIDNYDQSNSAVLAGAAELQKAFGYRFVLESVSYPREVEPGDRLQMRLSVRNTGSAPFYLDWPLAVGLLDVATRKLVWSEPLNGVDIRTWQPGENWDSDAFAYRLPARLVESKGHAELPVGIAPGRYILALAVLDRQGGMVPSVRFATTHYFRGGWHPLGFIGIGPGEAPPNVALSGLAFDDPAIDESLCYKVSEKLRDVQSSLTVRGNPVAQWIAEPHRELINPSCYWTLESDSKSLEIEIVNHGQRTMRVAGEFQKYTHLCHNFGNVQVLPPGGYRFVFSARGTAGQVIAVELADGWRRVSQEAEVVLMPEWQEYVIEFKIKTSFQEGTTLRFSLPRQVHGSFEVTGSRLRSIQ